MSKTRFDIAKDDIVSAIDNCNLSVFRKKDLAELLDRFRSFWRLGERFPVSKFIEYLMQESLLSVIKLEFPSVIETRYIWRQASDFAVAQSMRPRAYLSHYTALYLHELTDQIPKTIYVNAEQALRSPIGQSLAQTNIDMAFRNQPRRAKTRAPLGNGEICLLRGKNTDNLGVTEVRSQYNEKLSLTNVERTLIDIAVRPFYSGGVHEVARAYEKAQPKVSVNKLAAMLTKLEYIYPYHQAIGFYLENAGVYKKTQIDLLRNFDFRFDFYLVHGMKGTRFEPRWRLHVPEGFKPLR